jgi:FkbM family methyltransferase
MLGQLRNKVSHRLARWKYAPAIETEQSSALLRLGSEYGGWEFEQSSDLHNSTIVSCGLGEDASFDIEFAARFCAKVIIVDPTPRAICHFEGIRQRIGQPATESYAEGGKQPITSYDLSKITEHSLHLETSALWTQNTTLKFFAPSNPDHVSHSIVNFQNNYVEHTPHIEVVATTLETLLAKFDLMTVPLMKLDIEGAEIAVIQQMLDTTIRPRQLLVEFDQLSCPSKRSKQDVEATNRRLAQAGYICRYFDGTSNCLYILQQ